ncbi:3'(2'),5'-bisphosphate nucleotidase [Lysobacteraceae bacterium NML120232]|nr:3'(2'),5'-bisphosphate nucleotidase [Xanthomonadaceae bacterium NML08-0793]PJK11986.1 3'(2'),5'-bisphosphate nucleotidase [Xanthomonadaceae bacterium NML120232]
MQSALHEAVIAIAYAAGLKIMTVYAQDFGVDWKADASPVTAADMAAHEYISTQLAALTPDIPVLSEESADMPTAQRKSWQRLWLVDPLDGTREFIKKNGEFSVNIALIEDGIATWGVIVAPVHGFIYYGGAGQGAWTRCRPAGQTRPIQTRPAASPLQVAASRSHADARTDALIARLGDVEVIRLGSSLKFCRLAEGQLDLYARFGPTSEWDTAAGQAILEGAGGALVDLQGRRFRYNQRETLLNGDFLAAGDMALLGRLRS